MDEKLLLYFPREVEEEASQMKFCYFHLASVVLLPVLCACSGFLPYYFGVKKYSVAIVGKDDSLTELPQASLWMEKLLCVAKDGKSFWTSGRSANKEGKSLFHYDLSGSLIEEISLPDSPDLFEGEPIPNRCGNVFALLTDGRRVARNSKGSVSPFAENFYLDSGKSRLYFTRHHGFSRRQCDNDYNSIESIAVFNFREGDYMLFPWNLWGDGAVRLEKISTDGRFLLVSQEFILCKCNGWHNSENWANDNRRGDYKEPPDNYVFILNLEDGTVSEKKYLGKGHRSLEPLGVLPESLFPGDWIDFSEFEKKVFQMGRS